MKIIYTIFFLLFAGSLSFAQIYNVSATINGSMEVPPNGSAGTGTLTGTYDEATNMITLNAQYSGLTTALTASHLHQAAAGSNGGVIVNLAPTTGSTSGNISGTYAVPNANESALIAGNFYINLHTSTFPGGEIRGQLSLTPVQNYSITSDINEANEVPPTGSAATGTLTATYDVASKMITLNVDYTGLTAGLSGAHLHEAPAGSNGPVIVNLMPTLGMTSGNISGSYSVPAANEAALLAGNFYINLHTSTFPGGEIRGQLAIAVTAISDCEVEVESGDVCIKDSANGVVLKSENGNCFRLQVDNNGNVTTTAVTCP